MLLAFLAVLFASVATPLGAGIASFSLRTLLVAVAAPVVLSPLAAIASVGFLWLGLRAGVGAAPRLLELAGLSHIPMLVVSLAGLVLYVTLGSAVAAGGSVEVFNSPVTDLISLGYWIALPASVALVYVALGSLQPERSIRGALGFLGGQIAFHLLLYFGAAYWLSA